MKIFPPLRLFGIVPNARTLGFRCYLNLVDLWGKEKISLWGIGMGTFTAQILVGTPDLYHGGIIPTHYLFLSENIKPTWILEDKSGSQKFVWIATPKDTLEDALLMIAIHVCKDSYFHLGRGRQP